MFGNKTENSLESDQKRDPELRSVPDLHVDLVILDDCYPHPQSGFRLEEYNTYLTQFQNSIVLTTGAALSFFQPTLTLDELIKSHEQQFPALSGRVQRFDESIKIKAKLAYLMFAGNAYAMIQFIEKNNIPFVFTLYPGGNFLMNDAKSDSRLRAIFASPMFRKVIMTQKVTKDYILSRKLCKEKDIEFIYGVVSAVK